MPYCTRELDRKYRLWRIKIFLLTGLAYAGFYLTRKSFSVAKIGMKADDSIDMTIIQMAWVDTAYLTAYALGQFVWGVFGDRFGSRRIVLLGMIFSVICAVAMGASSITIMFGVFFCLQGICQSSGWAPLTKNFSEFFSRQERGTMMGLWCFSYSIGAFFAVWYAGWAGEAFGWRAAFYVPAVTLIVVGILFWMLQVDKPQDVGLPSIEVYKGEVASVLDEHEAPDEEKDGSWKVIKEVMASPMVWFLGLLYFLLKPTRYAILFWGPLYVSEKLGYNMKDSAFISGFFFLSGPLGAWLGGLASDKLFDSKRMPVCGICLFLLAFILFALDSFPATPIYLGGSLFLAGFLLYPPDIMISGIAAVDFGTRKGASTAAGITNGCGSVGAIFGGALPGFFKDKYGWDGVFGLLGCAVLLAAIIVIPQWNARPKTSHKNKEHEKT